MSEPRSGVQTTEVEQPAEPLRAEPEPTPWPPPALPGPGQVLAGRYTVLQVLGQGGMGVVLAAYDSRLDRRVALKLLPPERSGSEPFQARLLREAQAMARLNHPHVVTVHDAGTLEDGRLFIAMEYVQGQTLRAWCLERARSWREVLSAYLEAGRGLAAAHAVGLVHRDFKPDNALVGEDGRTRVTDFGVARAESTPTAGTPLATPLPVKALRSLTPSSAWQQALTQQGVLVGTPRYMAPEVLLGQPADARSDLFSFCVALWEALFREPPFRGGTLEERAEAMAQGQVVPPAGSQVPAWVVRALQQGLRLDPLRRPASMGELLAALEADPRVRRRARLRTAALGTAFLALTAVAAWGWVRAQGPGCARVGEHLAGVWDEQVREQVRQALAGTGLPYARDTAERVAAGLDGYVGRWTQLRVEACEAVRAEAGQPRSLGVLQEYCLERRRSQVRALTELLARGPDKELLPKAVQAVQALPPLEYCVEARALTAAVPPPEAPQVRAQAEALEPEVDRLEALLAAGKYKVGLEQAGTLLPRVETVAWPPLRARALYLAGQLSEGAGDYKAAETRAREAIALAAEGKDDVLLARAWSLLVMAVGPRQARHAEALALELSLTSAAARADEPLVQAGALNALGTLLLYMGRPEEALARYERALELRRKALGPEHPEVAAALNNLGLALQKLGRYEQARAHFEHVLAVRQRVLGPEHPLVAYALSNLGNVLKNMGQAEPAREHLERALALQERLLGPAHPVVANALNNLGLALVDLERYEEALPHFERALAVWEQALGPEHPEVATALNNLSIVLQRQGRYAQARARLEQALELRRKALGPEHVDLAYPLHNIGSVLLEQGEYAQARARLEQALALWERQLGPEHVDLADSLAALGRALVHLRQPQLARRHLERAQGLMEKGLGPEHPSLAGALLGLAELHLAQGQPAQAVPLLERALGLAQAADTPELQLTLARALWDSGQQLPRAHELASQAHAHYQRMGNAPRLAHASQWLTAHARQ